MLLNELQNKTINESCLTGIRVFHSWHVVRCSTTSSVNLSFFPVSRSHLSTRFEGGRMISRNDCFCLWSPTVVYKEKDNVDTPGKIEMIVCSIFWLTLNDVLGFLSFFWQLSLVFDDNKLKLFGYNEQGLGGDRGVSFPPRTRFLIFLFFFFRVRKDLTPERALYVRLVLRYYKYIAKINVNKRSRF